MNGNHIRPRREPRSAEVETLGELVRVRARENPEETAYILLADGDQPQQTRTFGELEQRAEGVAHRLQRLADPGERALLLFPACCEFLDALFGCAMAGVIAIPAPPPQAVRLERSIPRLRAILRDAGVSVVISISPVLDLLREHLDLLPELGQVLLVAVDDLPPDSPDGPVATPVGPDAIVYLQYTSGSTSSPKGVMITHQRLLRHCRCIAQACGYQATSVSATWMPNFHDYGLVQGLLVPLYAGIQCYFMSPWTFIKQPAAWLRAISTFQVTHSQGPNFAYDLCASRVGATDLETLNLSHWIAAGTGAEPIREDTLCRFRDVFGACGFRWEAFAPGFGLAEATLVVTTTSNQDVPILRSFDVEALGAGRVAPGEDGRKARTVVGCGGPVAGMEIAIVDPVTRQRCADDRVGEIWVRSGTAAIGYWGLDPDVDDTFGASLLPGNDRGYLRTGDLGFLYEDQLFVCGRCKDLIIVAGVNHYPNDIEHTVERSHALIRPSCCAAFSIEQDEAERLVIVAELRRGEGDPAEVVGAIRQAVVEAHDVEVFAVALTPRGQVLKTSSGKVQRQACRERFLSDTLEVILRYRLDEPAASRDPKTSVPSGAASAAAEMLDRLRPRLAEALQVDPSELGSDDPFSQFGLHSRRALELVAELETWSGRSLPPSLFYECPTLSTLAAYLATGPATELDRGTVPRGSRTAGEPIAVIGMSGRFPGSSQLDAYWRVLQGGVDATAAYPDERLADVAPTAAPEASPFLRGGYLPRVDLFDAEFFGISPKEATLMDPQQRWLLETAWEAIESAGYAPTGLAGTSTAVLVGVSTSDYGGLQMQRGDATPAHAGTGSAVNMIANRLSYFLHLRGPSLVVDTACSSSLVAVQLASESLRRNECEAALVAGVNLILSPAWGQSLQDAGVLSPDGRCKTFDEAADGYGRGEGCGVVMLKTLSRAIADQDPVLAVIRGVAVNQDGRSNSLTSPNPVAQEDVIRRALDDGGLAPHQVSYVEAHGSGTPLGDSMEIQALNRVFQPGRPPDQTCWIGSAKTNIGHLEAAAGMAGLIKVVLALQHRVIPPHLHLRQLNPLIDLPQPPFVIPTKPIPWRTPESRLVAGVASFGFGGTNAYAFVEEAPPRESEPLDRNDRTHHLLAISAKTPEALEDAIQRHAVALEADDAASWGDMTYSVNTGRSHFACRTAIVAASREDAARQLREDLRKPRTPSSGSPRIAFLFSGQGAQYVGMGRALYETQPGFRQVLDQCDEVLGDRLPERLLSVLYQETGEPNAVHQTRYAQPLLFALEYGLAQLWRSWGIEPVAVMGHSVGEYVAACVAGVFSWEDGLRLVAERGRLMQKLRGEGRMAAVRAGANEVNDVVLRFSPAISMAAINGPRQVVISGRGAAMEQAVGQLEARGMAVHWLEVSHAFHSELIEPMLEDLRTAAAQVTYASPTLPVVSNLTGAGAGSGDVTTAEYWCRHAREAVQFETGMRTLSRQGIHAFLEVGPHPVLLGTGRTCVEQPDAALWCPSLTRGQPDWESLANSLAQLYVHGAPVDWHAFDGHGSRRRVAVPTYPFQRKRYWLEPAEESGRGTPEITSSGLEEDLGDCLYKVAWRPQPPLASMSPAGGGVVLQRLKPLLNRDSSEFQDKEFLAPLEALSRDYAARALGQLGLPWAIGGSITLDQLCERGPVIPAHRQFAARLLQMVEEAGLLRREGDVWNVCALPADGDPSQLAPQLARRFPDAQAEWALVNRCGAALAAVMQGRCDPLEMLFPGDGSSGVDQLYRDAPSSRTWNRLVADVVQALLHQHPLDQPIRILEIGAGTGGTTASILSRLRREPEIYLFSDVSEYFLRRARQEFGAYPYLQFSQFDVERDEEVPDVETTRYDLVVAANVLHATRDIRQTLRRVRKLLAPGGALVLLEGTSRLAWVDVIFGLLEGWWKFADTALRPHHPLLSQGQWIEVLQEEGFDVPVALPASGDATQCVLVAGVAASEGEVAGEAGRWLLFADQSGQGDAVAAALQTQGEEVVTVLPGASFSVRHAQGYSIAPGSREDIERLIQATLTRSGPWRGVLYLWGLDAEVTERTSAHGLGQGLADAWGSLGPLLRAWTALPDRTGARLWLVTRGAQGVAGDLLPLAVAQSPAAGLARAIAVEHPDLWGGMVDLDPASPDRPLDAHCLMAEVGRPSPEALIAVRRGTRYAARLTRFSPRASQEGPFARSDASYLVSGGTGGLGLIMAQWLVDRGAGQVVLLSRHADALSPSQERAVERLQAGSTRIHLVAADIRNSESVAKVIDEWATHAGTPLRGIIHAAGVFDDRLLVDEEPEHMLDAMAAKVEGAWNLHQESTSLELDFFVLFSSTASMLPLPGAGNYAAANTFLDALSHLRASQGLPAVSIGWGPWAGTGMTERVGDPVTRGWERDGIRRLPVAGAVALFEQLLQDGIAQPIVARIDWSHDRATRMVESRSTFLQELKTPGSSFPPAAPAPTSSLREFFKVPPATRRRDLAERIRVLAAGVLGISDPASFDPGRPLGDLGMDSILAVQLAHGLSEFTGLSLPTTLPFDYPTVDRLTDFLIENIPEFESTSDRSADAAPPPADASTHVHDADIAVVGLGCRWPGAEDPAAFWRMLCEALDAAREVPPERWDREQYVDPDPDAPGKMVTGFGCFLDKIDEFDAGFFGIAPREAVQMDPQQRLLLEVCWEALEQSGQCVADLPGSETGVFVAMYNCEYAQRSQTPSAINAHTSTGAAASAAAGRISYVLGLQGPCLVVDTACSSSLVAAHLACQSLRQDECRMALVGGVNLNLSPLSGIALTKARMLSPGGRCRSFAATADGFGQGEGCGVLVLKRFDDALADGDQLLAVIRGSGVNQDGRSSSLTAPNGLAQQAVIRAALANSHLHPHQVQYVEAHGTGTALGDPIEVQALASALGEGRDPSRPLLVGSVKANIGHAEAAAGMAGLIKVILSLVHREIPPHVYVDDLNPAIPWQEIPVAVAAQRVAWPAGPDGRNAGVSSFGFSGTNAHVIVGDAPERVPVVVDAERPLHLLVLSAQSEPALLALVDRYATALASMADTRFADVCYTANSGRRHWAHRLTLVGTSVPDAARQLSAIADAGTVPGRSSGVVGTTGPKVAFICTGGLVVETPFIRGLADTQPTFRRALERCEEGLADILPGGILTAVQDLNRDGTDAEEWMPAVSVAVHIALADLWRSWGIEPAVVVGHGMGAYAAGYVAGVFSDQDAMRLVVESAVSTTLGGPHRVETAFTAPVLPIITDFSGGLATPEELTTAAFWRQPAGTQDGREAALGALAAQGATCQLELGPTPAWETLLDDLAALYRRGVEVDWRRFDQDYPRQRVSLPTYPFERRRYWNADAETGPVVAVDMESDEVLRDLWVGTEPPAYLADHRLRRAAVFPLAGYIETLLEIGRERWREGPISITDLTVSEALILSDRPCPVQVRGSFSGDRPGGFRVVGETALHAEGWLEDGADSAPPAFAFDQARARCPVEMAVDRFYDRMESVGLDYGPAFRGVRRIWAGHGEAVAQVILPEHLQSLPPRNGVRAPLWDACFQVVWAAAESLGKEVGRLHVPVAVTHVQAWLRDGIEVWSHASIRSGSDVDSDRLEADVHVVDVAGNVVMNVEGMTLQAVDPEVTPSQAEVSHKGTMFGLEWRIDDRLLPAPGGQVCDGAWLVFEGGDGISDGLDEAVSNVGQHCVWIRRGESYGVDAHGNFTIRVGSAADMERVVKTVAESEDETRGILYLAGPSPGSLDRPTDALSQEVEDTCAEVLFLLQALAKHPLGDGARLWIATRGAQFVPGDRGPLSVGTSPLWGLGRVIALEHSDLWGGLVDLDLVSADPSQMVGALLSHLHAAGGEDQIAIRQGRRYVARLTTLSDSLVPGRTASRRLEIASPGSLDRLTFVPAARREPGQGEIEIRVCASALNFRDVLRALGVYPGPDGPLGGECSGTVVRRGEDAGMFEIGDEVVVIQEGAFADFVTVPEYLVAAKPPEMTLAGAASVPIAFLTALVALDHVAQVSAGERVLIHSAAGGVGLAAVQVAQRRGATVFATAGNQAKRDYLHSLGVVYVGDSRALDFADQIRDATDGAGIDVVLNSLIGEAIPESLRLLRPGGRFVEMGKAELWSAERVGAAFPDVTYHPIAVDEWVQSQPSLMSGLLRNAVAAIARGEFKPLPTTEFSWSESVDAFRYMAQAKHMGKIVLVNQAEGAAEPRLRPDGRYLVVGGGGGLGLRVIEWLVQDGARHIVVMGRNPPSDGARKTLDRLEHGHARIRFVCGDVACAEDVRRIVSEPGGPPLRGVIHAAGILDDGVLLQQEISRFRTVFAAKVRGAWNLHVETRECPLDFFVLFSSAASLVGSPGQSNHAAANAFLDALAHHRRTQGLPGSCINWGAWSDVGAFARRGLDEQLGRRGLHAISVPEGIAIFAHLLRSERAQTMAVALDMDLFLRHYPGGHVSPIFSEIGGPPGTERSMDHASHHETESRVANPILRIEEEVIRIMGLDPAQPPPRGSPLRELGLDSLMATELRSALAKLAGRSLSASLLFDYPTVQDLAGHLFPPEERLEQAPERPPPAVAPVPIVSDAVAIIGVSCRFAGAEDVGAFWELLKAGGSGVVEVPRERWDVERLYDPSGEGAGTTRCKWGGFVDGVDEFDAGFFGISGREAELSDPQQRLFLEQSWLALEDAGYGGEGSWAERCGVFVGVSGSDYGGLLRDAGLGGEALGFMGNASSILAARIAYVLNLGGPALAVDTACSSSLVALCLGCESVVRGESEVALAGGVSVMSGSQLHVLASQAGMLSGRGRCAAYGADADGFVPGEGVGVVVLKSLASAQAAGDRIYGVIRGWAMNQDGRTNGLTAPSARAQTQVEVAAYQRAGISAETVGYIEGHGTGTRLGDPVEVEGLRGAFGRYTQREGFCGLGSVKTNIGHALSAAGVAGLIKALWCVREGWLVPTLHSDRINEELDLRGSPFYLTGEGGAWSGIEGSPRRAGVSSFGFSGTNAHVVIEEAPEPAARAAAPERPCWLVVLSGKTQRGLGARVADLGEWLGGEGAEAELGDVGYTLGVGRSHLLWRTGFVVSERSELIEALGRWEPEQALRSGEEARGVWGQRGQRLVQELGEAEISAGAYRKRCEGLLEVFCEGYRIDWDRLYDGLELRRVGLPGVRFERKRYWAGAVEAGSEPQVCLYMRGWERAGELPVGERPGRYLLLVGESGGDVVEALRSASAEQMEWEELAEGCCQSADLGGIAGVVDLTELTGGSDAGEGERIGLLQRLVRERGEDGVRVLQVSRGLGGAVMGALVRVVGVEHPGVRASSVCWEESSEARLEDVVLGELGGEEREVCYRAGGRYRPLLRRLGPVEEPAMELDGRKVYVLTGGTGSLGAAMGLHLVKQGARKLVLLAREPVNGGVREERVRALEAQGAEVRVYAGSLSEGEELGRFMEEVSGQWGPVGGVIHCGGVVPELAGFVEKDVEGMLAVLEPKVAGTNRLWELFGGRVDFMVLFSSVSTSDPRLGGAVCDYYAANGYLDAFARAHDGEGGTRVVSLGWGSWGETGRSSSPTSRLHLEPKGIVAMSTAEALAGYEAGLASGCAGVVINKSTAEFGRQVRLSGREQWVKLGVPPAPWSGDGGPIGWPPGEVEPELAAGVRWLEGYSAARVQEVLGQLGGRLRAGVSGSELAASVGAVKGYERLMDALSARWAQPGWMPEDPPEDARAGWEPYVDFLEACLARYGEVLRGEVAATEVVFADSSVELVEQIYGSNPLAERIHEGLGAAVLGRVRGASGRVRILEVGAGTGGASRGLLGALAGCGGEVQYHYTDLSASLVEHGREEFGHYGFVDFEVLDVEAAVPESQWGRFDVVVGSNVMHATRDVREGIRGLKRRLKPGGVLVLEELLGAELYATLSFGLLEGWWRYQDPELRLAHSPLLDGARWKQLLVEEGFEGVELWQPEGLSEGIVSARSDGWVAVPGAAIAAAPAAAPAPAPLAPLTPAGGPATSDRAAVVGGIRTVLSEALKVAEAELEEEVALGDFGVDSIVAVNLIKQINERFGTELRSTDIFNYPTVGQLADAVIAQGGGAPQVQAPRAPVAGGAGEAGRGAIAVIGIACRFPGAEGPEAYWDVVSQGRETIGEVPAQRWGAEAGGGQGGSARGGYLEQVDGFDPLFFQIAPREITDPRQKRVLEECYKALEDAGVSPESLSGSRTGVVMGVERGDGMVEPGGELDFRGTLNAMIPARIGYLLNLKGPCLAVDTACSSSLVAIHLGCEQLRGGSSDVVLAGGVNLILSARTLESLDRAGLLSARGQCRVFDERADGMVLSEGVGVVVLKRLEDAVADGDRIEGVIRGSGLNYDGKTVSAAAPSGTSQRELILEVYQRFGIDAAAISYVEAHGTGTRLGDPIEVEALGEAFGRYGVGAGRCALGSVKANIGHTAAASGVAGLIKVLLALRSRQLPPAVNFEEPNGHIDWAHSPFYVNRELKAWEVPAGQPRRGAISSFGASGTNAHLVVEEPPPPAPRPQRSRPAHLYVLSGKDPAGLARRRAELGRWLQAHGEQADPARVSYTLGAGRGHFEHRAAYVSGDLAELAAALDAPTPTRAQSPAPHPPMATLLQRLEAGGEDPAHYRSALGTLADAYLAGAAIDWDRLFPSPPPCPLSLPTYPFARDVSRHRRIEPSSNGPDTSLHPLVDRNTSTLDMQCFVKRLSPSEFFLKDHQIHHQALLPAAAYLEMARAAGEQSLPGIPLRQIARTVWLRPLLVSGPSVDALICLQPSQGAVDYAITTEVDGNRIVHTQGQLLFEQETPQTRPEPVPLETVKQRCRQRVTGDEFYQEFRDAGVQYGSSFEVVKTLAFDQGEVLCELELPSHLVAQANPYVLHPALLDGAIQAVSARAQILGNRPEQVFIPYALEQLHLFAPLPASCYAYVNAAESMNGKGLLTDCDVLLLDPTGVVVASLTSLSLRPTLLPKLERAVGECIPSDPMQRVLHDLRNGKISLEDAEQLLP